MSHRSTLFKLRKNIYINFLITCIYYIVYKNDLKKKDRFDRW